MLHGYRTDWATAFLTNRYSPSDGISARLAGVQVYSEELPMTTFSKTLIAAAALAAMTTSGFSQVPWEFNPDMAYMYSGPGKMTTMSMASGAKNHEAMMKHAKKVLANTVFFMEGGQMYMVSGTLDPTGNFYRP
jgi:peptidoglycan/LPS O-acetylase OafA/YrhL